MIQYVTQAPIEAQTKASFWLRQIESDPPDQSIQLIGSADESYRASVDEPLDSGSEDDEGSTMAGSAATRVTAGSKSADRYRDQLRRNQISEAAGQLMDKFYDFVAIFKHQVFDETAKDVTLATAPGQSIKWTEEIQKELRSIGQKWDDEGYKSDEWSLHHIMHRVLIRIIDPDAYEADLMGWKNYLVNSPGSWNYAPKVLIESKHDLSQPKVDTCFAVSMAQANFKDHEKDPLLRICDQVQKSEYRCPPLRTRHFESGFARAAELLSLDTLDKLNEHQSLREVCFCHSTTDAPNGRYPVSWFEIKWTPDEMSICDNQIINAGVFHCGKQIDLILRARELDAESASASEVLKNIDYVVALGMCIAGKEWKIIATVSRLGVAIEAAVFDYTTIARGNWQEGPKTFIGAVTTMHEYMQDRTLRILVECLTIFETWALKQQSSQLSAADDGTVKEEKAVAGGASRKEVIRTGGSVKKGGAKGGSAKAGEENNKLQQRLIPSKEPPATINSSKKPEVAAEPSKIPPMASIPEDKQ